MLNQLTVIIHCAWILYAFQGQIKGLSKSMRSVFFALVAAQILAHVSSDSSTTQIEVSSSGSTSLIEVASSSSISQVEVASSNAIIQIEAESSSSTTQIEIASSVKPQGNIN